MKIKESPLKYLSTSLLHSKVVFGFNEDTQPSVEQLIALSHQYDIDVDFAIDNSQPEHQRIFIKAEINNEHKLDGYAIFCECVCTFSLDENNLSKKEINNLKLYSSLNTSLNALRNYIMDITAKFPLGMYLLPSIDLQELIKAKNKVNKS